jgi:hypothetical protein
MGLLFLNAVGPKGEELAMAAGKVTDIAVGWDEEFDSATFDSDTYDEAELKGIVFDALEGIDPDWREHLEAVE